MEKAIIKKDSPWPMLIYFPLLLASLFFYGTAGLVFLLKPGYPGGFTSYVDKSVPVLIIFLAIYFIILAIGFVIHVFHGYQQKLHINWDGKTIEIFNHKLLRGRESRTYASTEIDSLQLDTVEGSPRGTISIKFADGVSTSIQCSIIADSTKDCLEKAYIFANAFNHTKKIKHFHDPSSSGGGGG